jgi:Transglutaminase-like superfamily
LHFTTCVFSFLITCGLLYLSPQVYAKNSELSLANSQAQDLPGELLANPYFKANAEGWYLQNAVAISQGTKTSKCSIRLNGVHSGPDVWSHVGVKIPIAQGTKALKFSCLLNGVSQGELLHVNAFCKDSAGHILSKTALTAMNSWKRFETMYEIPSDTTNLQIWVINTNSEEAYVAEASLIPTHASHLIPTNTNAHVSTNTNIQVKEALNQILMAEAQVTVRTMPGEDTGTGTVTFPVPGEYRDQIPLTFRVNATPSSALLSYRLQEREDGRNWLCEVRVRPPLDGVTLKWDSMVLVCDRPVPVLPKVNNPEVPHEASPWIQSTACVQSNDPAIRSMAASLGSNGNDLEDYARRVLSFTSQNKGKVGEEFNALDAKRALECGGSCTSRANLAAALLRARGIPARTLAHLPTWSGPLYEHWLVEYWHPGVGWVWLETTMGKFEPPSSGLVVLAESNPDDENRAFDKVHLRYVMPGAAYLSVPELSPELTGAGTQTTDATNKVVLVSRVSGSDSELSLLKKRAHDHFKIVIIKQDGLRNTESALLRTAILSGQSSAISKALQ